METEEPVYRLFTDIFSRFIIKNTIAPELPMQNIAKDNQKTDKSSAYNEADTIIAPNTSSSVKYAQIDNNDCNTEQFITESNDNQPNLLPNSPSSADSTIKVNFLLTPTSLLSCFVAMV